MRPHLICFILVVSACTKGQSDSATSDTPRALSVDTGRAEAVPTPATKMPVDKFALLNPKAGDTLIEGRTYVVQWTHGPVRHINLGAVMGGHDKGFILNNAPAEKDSLAWKVPVGFVTGFGLRSSNQVRLRLENADSTEQWVEAGPFVVRGAVSVVSTMSSESATSVLTSFEKTSSSGRSSIPDEVRSPERYSAARVDSVLTGLERIAGESGSGFQTSMAVLAIMTAGSGSNPPAGIQEREIRLYRGSKSIVVRNAVLGFMSEQKHRPGAIAFLKSVATQSGLARDFEYAPYHAAESLSDMGADGRAALLDLQKKKLLQDDRAAGFTHWFLSTKGAKD